MMQPLASTLVLLLATASLLPHTHAYYNADPSNSTIISANSAYSGSTLPASENNPTCNPPPDVYLVVPNLSVGNITLNVSGVYAAIALNANIANIVQIDVGVNVTLNDVYLEIDGVQAQLELEVRLDKVVDIVNKTFNSLDLNPLLAGLANGIGVAANGTLIDLGSASNLLNAVNGLGLGASLGSLGGLTGAASGLTGIVSGSNGLGSLTGTVGGIINSQIPTSLKAAPKH